jgi:Ca2+-binding RTX toxin-like protein
MFCTLELLKLTLSLTPVSTIQDIHGLGGNDTLTGGSVNDIITGGNGNDTLQGNGGADTFKYHFKTAGNDTILDFDTNSDKIDLGGFTALV